MDGLLDFLDSVKNKQKEISQRITDLRTILRLNVDRLGAKAKPTIAVLDEISFSAKMALEEYASGASDKEKTNQALDLIVERLKKAQAVVNKELGPPAYRQKGGSKMTNRVDGLGFSIGGDKAKVRDRSRLTFDEIAKAREILKLEAKRLGPLGLRLGLEKLNKLDVLRSQLRDLSQTDKLAPKEALSRLSNIRGQVMNMVQVAKGLITRKATAQAVLTKPVDQPPEVPVSIPEDTPAPVDNPPSAGESSAVQKSSGALTTGGGADNKKWWMIGALVVGVGLVAWYASSKK